MNLRPIDTTHLAEVAELKAKLRAAEDAVDPHTLGYCCRYASGETCIGCGDKENGLDPQVSELQGLVRELAGALQNANNLHPCPMYQEALNRVLKEL